MTEVFVCILIGYLIGTLSPSAIIGKIKHINLKKQGTGNLGAMNTMLMVGKRFGALVMFFDILKAFLAVKLAQKLYPAFYLAGIITGASTVVGHVYPFYMHFKGGKGLAAFGGAILALKPGLFLFLLSFGFGLMLIFNYSVALPMSAGILFPIIYGFQTKDLATILIAVFMSALIIVKHASNITKAKEGKDNKVREYLSKNFGKKR